MSVINRVWMRCDKRHKAGIRREDATSAYCAKCKEIVSVTPDYTIVIPKNPFASAEK